MMALLNQTILYGLLYPYQYMSVVYSRGVIQAQIVLPCRSFLWTMDPLRIHGFLRVVGTSWYVKLRSGADIDGAHVVQ